MISIETLIKQYGTETYRLDKVLRSIDERDPVAAEEANLISEMISDLRFSMAWMRSGKNPGVRRGIEQTNIYYKNELLEELKSKEMSPAETQKLVYLLLALSRRERQCFLLHSAHGLTYAEISAKLELSRASVQRFVERARNKIQQGI
jgi:RNA polymerase sigma factor (sigma-70 family)